VVGVGVPAGYGHRLAILVISAVPVYAQEQRPNTEKLKADVQKVFKTISGDRLIPETVSRFFRYSISLMSSVGSVWPCSIKTPPCSPIASYERRKWLT
jgi:hypothetical protein